MAKTTPVYARIDSNLKENAENILSQLGISPSSLIQMVYSQVVLKKGVPFELTLENKEPIAMGSLSRAELNLELEKGMDSINNGKVYTSSDVNMMFESRE